MVPNSLEKSALKVSIKESVTVSGQSEETLIPMTKIQEQNGNGLKVLADGTIQATRDMNVFASALINIYVLSTNLNNATRLSIQVNNKIISSDQHSYSAGFHVISYIKLKKNDIIKLTFIDFNDDISKTGSNLNTNHIDIFEI